MRIISATNRDIVQAIRDNEFREDLYHRLNVMKFQPPPLSKRGEDVILLAEYFLAQNCDDLGRSQLKISHEAMEKLLSHKWPGNVRELRNVMERAAILEQTAEVQPGSLPDFVFEARLRDSDDDSDDALRTDLGFAESVAEFERNIIKAALEQSQYNVNRTAEQLKMTRHSLRYRMQQLGITNPSAKGGDTHDGE